jgi:hypothetical protein
MTRACAAVATVLAMLLVAPNGALAGQPWSCDCKGERKRFIASTYKCEADLHKGRAVRSGGKLLVPRCTQSQFRNWNRKACAAIGCRLPNRY